jgi:hypothetical protein
MHYRRIACWLLGAWFIGSLAITRITSSNFSAADEVLEAQVPEIHRVSIGRGRPVARGLMRYMAAELNRGYYASWEWLELALGAGVAGSLLLDRQKRILIVPTLAGMVLVAFQHFWLSPEIVYIEIAQSFPPPGPPPSSFQFGRMQMLYTAVEAAKLLLVLGVTYVLIKMQGQRRRTRVRRVIEEPAVDVLPPTAAV